MSPSHHTIPEPRLALGQPGGYSADMAIIYWNVRPEIFTLGPFTVRWYGLLFGVLFIIGYLVVRWQFRIEGKPEKDLDSLLVHLVLGTIIGARLGHCLFYEPKFYLSHPIEILKVWEGGLASHGGTAGVLIAMYLYCRKRPDQPYLWLVDRVAVPTAFGACLIRLGNLFNSEILGLPTQVPWAFIFARVSKEPLHPAQLYESVCYLLVFVVLLALYNRLRAATPQGLLTGIFLILVFGSRFFIEFVKERQADYEQSFPVSVGQLLSIPFIVAGAMLVWRALAQKKPPPRPEVQKPTPAH